MKGSHMKIKTRPATITVKAAEGDDETGAGEGVFEAIVATYDLDSMGDKIVPGAFKATLDEWAKAGDPIPVLWSHMHQDPDYHIGVVEQAEERDGGLWVRARLDLDEPKAAKVHRLLKGGRVKQFSFAYDVIDGGPVKAKADEDGDGEEGPEYYELRELKLYEVGPTLIGANERTELLAVKADNPHEGDGTGSPPHYSTATTPEDSDNTRPAVKAGRTLSAKNEGALKDALVQINGGADAIKSVLASIADDSKHQAMPVSPAPPEEPPAGAKEAPPARPGAASVRLHTDLALLAAEVDS